MHIQIASDLDLEHLNRRLPDYRGVVPSEANVLALELFIDSPYTVIYVPGNHEYYRSSTAQIRPARSSGIHA